jgi:hypothetical protein
MKNTEAGKIFLIILIFFAAAPIVLFSLIFLNGFVAFIFAAIFAGVAFGSLKFIKFMAKEKKTA